MPGTMKLCALAMVIGTCLSLTSPISAQEVARGSLVDDERDASLYYPAPTNRPDARAIIHQKAQIRAYQRQSRLAALNWYGMSNSRPTAAPTPFTSRYSPTWEMPGGRPFSWHVANWPVYVYYTR
jgi:hypothetical protein